MRRTSLLLAVLLAFALLPQLVSGADPGPGDPIIGSGTVHGGLYPYNFWFASDFDEIAAATWRKVTFAGIFHNVDESDDPGWPATNIKLEQAWAAEATPFSNLELTDSAAFIAGGDRDADLTEWATAVKGWLDRGGGRSLIIAPMQEMNGDWLEPTYGMEPDDFQLAYKRVKDIVEATVTDPDMIRWAFAPNGWSSPPHSMIDYYPGDDVVDVISISAYNFGTTTKNGWEPPAEAILSWIDEARAMTAGSADKPYLLSQTGSVTAGGSKAQWIRDMFTVVEDDPNLVGLVYFNITTAAMGLAVLAQRRQQLRVPGLARCDAAPHDLLPVAVDELVPAGPAALQSISGPMWFGCRLRRDRPRQPRLSGQPLRGDHCHSHR